MSATQQQHFSAASLSWISYLFGFSFHFLSLSFFVLFSFCVYYIIFIIITLYFILSVVSVAVLLFLLPF